MRSEKEVREALEIIERLASNAIAHGSSDASDMAFGWGLLQWILNNSQGDVFQRTIEACKAHDLKANRHAKN